MSCIIKRLITLTVPIKFQTITVFDDKQVDVTNNSLFSWSMDGVCWTNFVSYEQYLQLAKNIESDFYLRILIMSGFSNLALANKLVDCYTICLYNENPYLMDLCANQTIDFYANLDCALQMYTQMSDLICCMIGIPVYYFRVLPDKNTADYTFKEYVLHNVIDMKYLKLVVPDGTMPSSKPQMTEFDFDWEVDWEVEMSKSAFAKAFGDTAFPKQRDIIYIPMMKRMWEVNEAYDEKNEGFMWRPVTWKLALVKWNDKTNINQGDFQDIIDEWAVNRMEDFLPIERTEQERTTGVIQTEAPLFKPDTLYTLYMKDAVRGAVTKDEIRSVNDVQLNHRAAVVARNVYDFKSSDSAIQYQHKYCGDSGELIFILSPQKEHTCTLIQIGDLKVTLDNLTIDFNGLKQQLELNHTYVVQCKWDLQTFTTSLNIYPHICTAEGLPPYQIKPEMYIIDFEHPLCQLTKEYNHDFNQQEEQDIYLKPYSVLFTNFKLFNQALSEEESARESIKYTTKNDKCILNDVARPFEDAMGFSVR